MKKTLLFSFLLSCIFASAQVADSVRIRAIYDHCLTGSKCYQRLGKLCNDVGGRLSGSPQAAKAVEWARQAMYDAGADTVILQPCMVPHWVRGEKEICYATVNGKKTTLACIALGSSVGTGAKGLEAQVVEVSSFDELDKLGTSVKGKIVFYNVFFDQRHIRTGKAYSEAVVYRGRGASRAARHGAIAVVIRSMSSVADNEPHTGNMFYDTSISKVKIPAVAISYLAADQLHDAVKNNQSTKVFLRTMCETLPDAPSYNVIGQINGSLKDGKYIAVGGHLDSWDNGQGAHDDGSGVVQSIEVLAIYKALGIRPRHTIRAVAFMNEENGLAGGIAYAKNAKEKNEVHIAALESDAGGYTPRGFGVDTTAGLYNQVASWKHLFQPYLISWIEKDGGGADLRDIEKMGVPCIGFEPDTQRYFDIHHTAADTFDKINKRELELGAAAMGALIYMIDTYR